MVVAAAVQRPMRTEAAAAVPVVTALMQQDNQAAEGQVLNLPSPSHLELRTQLWSVQAGREEQLKLQVLPAVTRSLVPSPHSAAVVVAHISLAMAPLLVDPVVVPVFRMLCTQVPTERVVKDSKVEIRLPRRFTPRTEPAVVVRAEPVKMVSITGPSLQVALALRRQSPVQVSLVRQVAQED